MEYTKNKIPTDIQKFFNKLSKYIDEKIYFYGSVQRIDYFPENSDIDIHIFTDNVHEMVNKVCHYLHIDKKVNATKLAIYLANAKTMVYGYKIQYKCRKLNFITEITIYNKKYKSMILEEDKAVTNMPFVLGVVIYILKYLYYKLHFLTGKQYKKYKCQLIDIYKNHIFSDKVGLTKKSFILSYDNNLFDEMI